MKIFCIGLKIEPKYVWFRQEVCCQMHMQWYWCNHSARKSSKISHIWIFQPKKNNIHSVLIQTFFTWETRFFKIKIFWVISKHSAVVLHFLLFFFRICELATKLVWRKKKKFRYCCFFESLTVTAFLWWFCSPQDFLSKLPFFEINSYTVIRSFPSYTKRRLNTSIEYWDIAQNDQPWTKSASTIWNGFGFTEEKEGRKN